VRRGSISSVRGEVKREGRVKTAKWRRRRKPFQVGVLVPEKSWLPRRSGDGKAILGTLYWTMGAPTEAEEDNPVLGREQWDAGDVGGVGSSRLKIRSADEIPISPRVDKEKKNQVQNGRKAGDLFYFFGHNNEQTKSDAAGSTRESARGRGARESWATRMPRQVHEGSYMKMQGPIPPCSKVIPEIGSLALAVHCRPDNQASVRSGLIPKGDSP